MVVEQIVLQYGVGTALAVIALKNFPGWINKLYEAYNVRMTAQMEREGRIEKILTEQLKQSNTRVTQLEHDSKEEFKTLDSVRDALIVLNDTLGIVVRKVEAIEAYIKGKVT